jgi:hypothetical protein
MYNPVPPTSTGSLAKSKKKQDFRPQDQRKREKEKV